MSFPIKEQQAYDCVLSANIQCRTVGEPIRFLDFQYITLSGYQILRNTP